MAITLLVGTEKGLFALESDDRRDAWTVAAAAGRLPPHRGAGGDHALVSVARAQLRLPTMLAGACGGSTRVDVEGRTVQLALEDAIRRHPLLRTHLLDEDGRVREHLHLFLNEDDVREELTAALADGDQLTVLQQMSGGLS